MELTDILPVEIWENLEREANAKFGLNASIFDVDGRRITKWNQPSNPLCAAIHANDQGATHICARSHQNIAGRARLSGQAIVDECDAGLLKISVPIFVNDEFVGTFGGCGRALEDEEIDVFYISKITGIPEDDIEKLVGDVGTLSRARSEEVAEFLTHNVRQLFEATRH